MPLVRVIWTSPYLVESHLLFLVIDPICHFKRCGTDVIKARMPPAGGAFPYRMIHKNLQISILMLFMHVFTVNAWNYRLPLLVL